MELTELINHPERMDRDTLYELRSMVALYPYFQTARLLLLQNLYLLHDATFDEELRNAAIYLTDRKVIFNLVEAMHYRLQKEENNADTAVQDSKETESRTISLIDNFLESMPKDEEQDETHHKRKPTAADAAVDYVAYLLESSNDSTATDADTPQFRGQSLIDSFLEDNQGKIVLSEETGTAENASTPHINDEPEPEENYFTEALARIYVKQGRFQKALDIITRLSEQFPHKNLYFEDQIRFLEKLIINNNKKI